MSGKTNPSLRPIINKHRKTPSLTSILVDEVKANEKSCSKSMNVSKTESVLPKIFQVPLNNKKCITKANLPPIPAFDLGFVSRNVSTPFFNTSRLVNAQGKEENIIKKPFHKRKITRNKFFDHIKSKDLRDLSFGEIQDNFNSQHPRNKAFESLIN